MSHAKRTRIAREKYEIVFEFVPETEDAQESFWEFTIPEHGAKQKILLAGQVREPRVEIDVKHVNFYSVLTSGRSVKVVNIVNREHIPFSFSFIKSSFDFSRDMGATPLKLSPMSGTIPPNGSLPVEVTFSPTQEKDFNFNVHCVVDRKPMNLSLNVKGHGAAVHERIVLDDIVAFGSSGMNNLDFGHVHVNDTGKREIAFYNDGTFNYDYVWTYDELPPGVTIEPSRGTVRAGDRSVCTFAFNPRDVAFVESSNLSCTVAGGRNSKFS